MHYVTYKIKKKMTLNLKNVDIINVFYAFLSKNGECLTNYREHVNCDKIFIKAWLHIMYYYSGVIILSTFRVTDVS